jgi:hypothetical protein
MLTLERGKWNYKPVYVNTRRLPKKKRFCKRLVWVIKTWGLIKWQEDFYKNWKVQCRVSPPRPIQLYQFQANIIWLDGPFNKRKLSQRKNFDRSKSADLSKENHRNPEKINRKVDDIRKHLCCPFRREDPVLYIKISSGNPEGCRWANWANHSAGNPSHIISLVYLLVF